MWQSMAVRGGVWLISIADLFGVFFSSSFCWQSPVPRNLLIVL
jgi:hypothetical protein